MTLSTLATVSNLSQSYFQSRLPVELVQSILAWLPLVLETQQYRLLCRSANTAIASQSFAHLHLQRHMTKSEISSSVLSAEKDKFGILLFVGNGIHGLYFEAYKSIKRDVRIKEVSFIGGTETQLCLHQALPSLVGVTHFSLTSTNMGGFIPDTIGYTMNALTTLILSGNGLKGEIPESLFNLIGLTELCLDRNHLQGSIPKSIGKLVNLKVLNLEHNELRGELPDELKELQLMQILSLGGNRFTGSVPNAIASLPHLFQLNLHPNEFDRIGIFREVADEVQDILSLVAV